MTREEAARPEQARSGDDGTVVTVDGRWVLRYERRLAHPPARVWASLTEPARLRGWLADADVELREGGAVELRWLNTDETGDRAVARGTITRLEAERALELETDIHSLLRWELTPDGQGTLLVFTNVTPAPEDFLTRVLAGWHVHLDHLADALDGNPVVAWDRWYDDHLPCWNVHEARYAAHLGRAPAPITRG